MENKPAAITFDDKNMFWNPGTEYNLMFLRVQQSHANDKLDKQGHLFLNEVYDMLGAKRTPEGAVTGWLKGDSVSFGLFEDPNKIEDLLKDYPVELEFNITGIIYDKI